MDNKLFISMCNKINCDTYEKIELALLAQGIGLYVASQYAAYQNYLSTIPLELACIGSTFGAIALMQANGEKYTKDIIKIKELYNEFIEKYNMLNKTFSLNNPVEIYTMFNYLLNKGYLSKDKIFNFKNDKEHVNGGIYGARILTGNGVCRHTASLLTDILSSYDIEAYNLRVCLNIPKINICAYVIDEEKYTLEELIEFAKEITSDEESLEYIINFIKKEVIDNKENIELSYKKTNSANIIRRILGNHLITTAYQNNKVYFLDPTHEKIYRKNQNRIELSDKEYGIILIKRDFDNFFNSKEENKCLKRKLKEKYSSETEEDIKRMVDKIQILCSQNIDIFEQFYQNNSELYYEITDKMKKIRTLKLK